MPSSCTASTWATQACRILLSPCKHPARIVTLMRLAWLLACKPCASHLVTWLRKTRAMRAYPACNLRTSCSNAEPSFLPSLACLHLDLPRSFVHPVPMPAIICTMQAVICSPSRIPCARLSRQCRHLRLIRPDHVVISAPSCTKCSVLATTCRPT